MMKGISRVITSTIVFILWGTINGMGQEWSIVQMAQQFIPLKIYFLNENSGWATDDSAVVYRSVDGGRNWECIHPANTGLPDQRDLFFMSETVGFMVGESGSIFKTEDGGSNWVSIADPAVVPATTLESVYFVNDTVGYVCGKDSTLCKTSDGGFHWERQSIPLENSKEDLIDLAFFDAQNGICVSNGNTGTVLITRDGGNTWEKVDLSGQMPPGTVSKKLYAVDIYGDRFALVTGYHRATFFSSDTGRTWTRVGPYTTGFYYNNVCAMIDENTMFVGGQNGFLVRTTNAWASWDTLYTGSATDIQAMQFFSAQRGIISQLKYVTAAHLFQTEDGGTTWHPLLDWPNITFWRAVATPENRIVAVSSDGGEWTVGDVDDGFSYPTHQPFHSGFGLYNILYLENGVIITTGEKGYIGVSTDGGFDFRPIPTKAEGSVSKMQAITCWGSDSVWVASSKGEIFWSFDGGNTWIDTIDVGTESIYDLYALDARHLIACANKGTILHSDDAGISWQKNVVASGRSFYDMTFIDSRTGYFVSDKGIIWKTEDSGQTIQPVDTVDCGTSFDRLYGIATNPTGSILLSVGENGAAFFSVDSGRTWQNVEAPVHVNLRSVAWADDGFYVVGDHGTILHLKITIPAVSAQQPQLAQDGLLPKAFRLYPNYPNPFNPVTNIRFELPRHSSVEIHIFDALGRKVKTLYKGRLAPGAHQFSWDATDENGVHLSSGVYFYYLAAEGFQASGKMILMK